MPTTTTRRLERAGWLLALKDIYAKVRSAETQLFDATDAGAMTSAMTSVAGVRTTIEELLEWDYA